MVKILTQLPRPQPGKPEPTKPKRVRGGRRVRTKERPVGMSTMARTWSALFDAAATEEILTLGFEYATLGQIVSIDLVAGGIESFVQGRSKRPYNTRILFPAFAEADWDNLIEKLAIEAGSVAALMDMRVPDSVLNTLAAIDLPLIPTETSDLRFYCSCTDLDEEYEDEDAADEEEDEARLAERRRQREMRGLRAPCKHIAALAFYMAEFLDQEPMAAFAIRGTKPSTFLERLKLQRIMDSSGGTAHAVQDVDLSEVGEDHEAALNEITADGFWSAGPLLDEVTDDLIHRDGPRHALLRRLGQSPFVSVSRFPMVGLLATCYDIISEAAHQEQMGEAVVEEDFDGDDDVDGVGDGGEGG